MKHKGILLKGFGDAVPIACGMIACVCAAMTAYEIGFLQVPFILFCVFAAILLSFWMNLPKYGFGFGAVFFTCVIMLCAFRMKQIGEGALALFDRLLDALPTELFGLLTPEMRASAALITEPETCITLFLILPAAFFGFMLSFSLIRSKMIFLPLLIPLPMLLVSLVYTNRPPALWTMALLTVYFGYALLGNGLRRGDSKKRGLFSVILAPALLALVLLIGAAFPQDNFEALSEERRKAFFSEQFGSIADLAMSLFGVKNPRSVDLSDEGEREEDDTELFTVYARSGTYLLRTHSYGAYRKNRWKNADEYKGEWNSMEALGKRQENADGTMWIFDSISGERVAPYAWTDEPAEGDSDEQSGIPNAGESFVRSGGWRDYSWRYASRYQIKADGVTEEERAYYEDFALKQYVMQDGEEKQALLDILKDAGIAKTGNTLETANAVAAFVRNSGTYSLSPGDVPKKEDFILYFLTENHKGYCVHFASATTALLQALEIPARYTIGYYAEIPAELSNKGLTVTKNDEHAWTEVYILGVGWVPVESTPGRGIDREAPIRQNEDPESTAGRTSTPEPTSVPTPEPTPASTNEPEQTAEPTPKPGETASPTPSSGGQIGNHNSGQNGGEGTRSRKSAWWLLIPLLPIAWVGAGLLVRRRRESRFRDPNVRRSIPDMTRYLRRMERFGAKKDPDAMQWAVEATFSNHKMKAEHRTLLIRVHEMQRTLCKEKPILRFILKWVLYLI